nr:unnamed protein product [Callosobruchus chinensis]
MICHEHVSSIATAADGKNLGYLFRARNYFSPSNLLSLYKAHIRPSLEYCSHIWGAAAPAILSILGAVHRRAIRLIGDPALTRHLQPLSHRRAVGDLSLFYLYSNGFCSHTLETSSSQPKAVVPFFIHQEPNDTTASLSPGRPGPVYKIDDPIIMQPVTVINTIKPQVCLLRPVCTGHT